MAVLFVHLLYSAIIIWLGVRNKNLSKVLKAIKSLPPPGPFVEIVPIIETLTLPPAPGPSPIAPEIPPDFCINAKDAPQIIAESFAPLPNTTKYIVKVYNVIQKLPEKLPETTNLGKAILILLGLILLWFVYYDYRYLSRKRRNPQVENCDSCISPTALQLEQEAAIEMLTGALDTLTEECSSLKKFRDLSHGLTWELQQITDQHEVATEDQKAEISVKLDRQRRIFVAKVAAAEAEHQELMYQRDHAHEEAIKKLREDLQAAQTQNTIWRARANNQQPENVIRQAATDTQVQNIKNQAFADAARAAEHADESDRRLRLDNDRLRRENTQLRRKNNDDSAALKKLEDQTQHFKNEVASRQLQSETFEAILNSIDEITAERQQLHQVMHVQRNILSPIDADIHPHKPFSRVETDHIDVDAGLNSPNSAIDTIRVSLNSDVPPRQLALRRHSDANANPDTSNVKQATDTTNAAQDEGETDDEDADDKPEDPKDDDSHKGDDDDDHKPDGAAGAGPSQGSGDSGQADDNTGANGAPNDGTQTSTGAPNSTTAPNGDLDMYDAPLSATSASPRIVLATQSMIPRPVSVSAAPRNIATPTSVSTAPERNDNDASALADNLSSSGLGSSGDQMPRHIRIQHIPNVLARTDDFGLDLPRFSRSARDLPEDYERKRNETGRVRQWNRTHTNDYNRMRDYYERMNSVQSKTSLVWREFGPPNDVTKNLRPEFRVLQNGQTRFVLYEDYLSEHNLLNNRNLYPPPNTPTGPVAPRQNRDRIDRRGSGIARTGTTYRPSSSGCASANPQSAGQVPQSSFTFQLPAQPSNQTSPKSERRPSNK